MIKEQALKDRLQAIAREKAIPFNACWKQLLLERFLARLARSPYADKLIFKGGFLLAYMMKIGRETMDLDFLLTRMKAEKQNLKEVCEEIAAIPSNDGFVFFFANIEPLSQPHMNYPGYRVTLNASFAKMKDKIHIDIGIGDAVKPQHLEIKLFQYRGKPFFEDTLSLLVYPIETIFAEKLETVLSKGSGNSRMKDYHDLLLLVRGKELINHKKLKKAVSNTFANRETPLILVKFDEAGLKAMQRLWTAHINGLGNVVLELNLPKNISEVIEKVNVVITELLEEKKSSLGKLIAEMKGKPLFEKVKEALAVDADVNDDSRNRHRPLQMALKKGETEVARLLIEHGADLNHRDRSGSTPLETAVNHGQIEIAKFLIKQGAHFNPNAPNLGFHYPNLYQLLISR